MSNDQEERKAWNRGIYGWPECIFSLVFLIITVIAAGLITGIIIGLITVSALVIVILLSIAVNWKGRETRFNPVLNVTVVIIVIILIIEIIHFVIFFGIGMSLQWFVNQVWYLQQLGVPPEVATLTLYSIMGFIVLLAVILTYYVYRQERRRKASTR